ncbi:hypothetical protein EDB80DRAFT_729286 [Ilyonectria destructans]|nr:hypothetical protein EDB80DRAFT_729286 [Ilyonectria destructans]
MMFSLLIRWGSIHSCLSQTTFHVLWHPDSGWRYCTSYPEQAAHKSVRLITPTCLCPTRTNQFRSILVIYYAIPSDLRPHVTLTPARANSINYT